MTESMFSLTIISCPWAPNTPWVKKSCSLFLESVFENLLPSFLSLLALPGFRTVSLSLPPN